MPIRTCYTSLDRLDCPQFNCSIPFTETMSGMIHSDLPVWYDKHGLNKLFDSNLFSIFVETELFRKGMKSLYQIDACPKCRQGEPVLLI